MEVLVPRARATEAFLSGLSRDVEQALPSALRDVSIALRENVRRRIVTNDGGTWRPVSKWIRAKKNARKPLAGMQNRVKSRVFGSRRAEVFFESPGEWTLTQHHEGFNQPQVGPEDEYLKPFVVLNIVNPRPLSLPGPGRFAFVPRRQWATPARRIWTSETEAVAIAVPLIERWAREKLMTKSRLLQGTIRT